MPVPLKHVLLILTVMAGAWGCGPEAVSLEPVVGVDAQHYDVVLRLDPATRTVAGHARLHVHHPDTLLSLTLAFGPLQVDTVRVDGRIVAAERVAGGLAVPLDGDGASVIDVHYGGVPDEGLYVDEHEGREVVYTDAWPDRIRGWLPGLHHPSDPATLSLTLDLPARPGVEAVASGIPLGAEQHGDRRRHRWHLATAAPTYTFAFAVADFAVTEAAPGDSIPVRYVMLAADSAEAGDLRRTPRMLEVFSDMIGPYPFEGYASVQVPFGFGGMENAAAVFLQAGLFAADAAESVQAHEAAHQWFGNRVVIADWRDLWISEGWATYLTTLFYEREDGAEAARARWADMAALTASRSTTHKALVPQGSAPPDEMLSWVAYDKGGSVLHLLRLHMGDDAFFEALRQTYAQYAGRPLSTPAFQDLLQQHTASDLDPVFRYWVYGSELPVLKTAWDAAEGALTWEVTRDAGTLTGVPFLLEVTAGGDVRYVPAGAGRVALPPGASAPAVRPVGIMMRVE